MYVIEVIVFARAAPPGALTYRSRRELLPGTVVSVPLRRQKVRGVVAACVPVAEAKARLKTAHFALAGSEVSTVGSLPTSIMDACEAVAAYHATTLGSVLAALLGDVLPETLPDTYLDGDGYAPTPVEAASRERFARYRDAIETARAAGRAALLILPTIAEVERAKRAFADLVPVVLSGSTPPVRRAACLSEAAASTGLVIATPAFSFVPIRALGLVILDRVSAGTYRQPKRPYLDLVMALRALARSRALPVLLGDYPLPLELRADPERGMEDTLLGTLSVLDARPGDDIASVQKDRTFKAVPDAMRARIKDALGAGEAVAVIASRKGYAPAVVCRDCGTTVKDAEGRTLALARVGGEAVLRSSGGETLRNARALCDICGSWNLLPLGVGVERVEEELAAAFPEHPLVRFDADTASTPGKAKKLLARAREEGGILVGTEALLPWLDPETPLSFAGIASADSLLALPFWRSRERFVRLALMLRERADAVMLATRRPDDTALKAARDPADPAFFSEEAMLRRALSYPPYATFVKLEAEGTVPALDRAFGEIRRALVDREATVFPDRPVTNGRMKRVALLRLPPDAWPDPRLALCLAALPPGIRITIDPENFW